MAGLEFGSIFVEGSLGLGIILQHGGKDLEVFEEIFVGQMATGKLGELSGQADKDSNRKQGVAVVGEEVQEGREKQSGGLLFLRK